MSDVKYMDIREFREGGYLQEVNRRFFHPLGLALEVEIHEDGTEKLGKVWDYRDDPEGIIYDPDIIDEDKLKKVKEEWHAKTDTRMKILGYMVQPK